MMREREDGADVEREEEGFQGGRNRRFRSPWPTSGALAGLEVMGCLGFRWWRSSRQELQDLLDGVIRFAVGRLDLGCGHGLWLPVRGRVEEAVGERTTDALVKETEQ